MQFQPKQLCSHLAMTILCGVGALITPAGANGEEKGPLVHY